MLDVRGVERLSLSRFGKADREPCLRGGNFGILGPSRRWSDHAEGLEPSWMSREA